MKCECISIAAEDRFAVVNMSSEKDLFPHPFTLGNLGTAISQLNGSWDFLWDFRFAGNIIYEDIQVAWEEAAASSNRNVILVTPE